MTRDPPCWTRPEASGAPPYTSVYGRPPAQVDSLASEQEDYTIRLPLPLYFTRIRDLFDLALAADVGTAFQGLDLRLSFCKHANRTRRVFGTANCWPVWTMYQTSVRRLVPCPVLRFWLGMTQEKPEIGYELALGASR
jgi:hypothetical protein